MQRRHVDPLARAREQLHELHGSKHQPEFALEIEPPRVAKLRIHGQPSRPLLKSGK